MKRLALPILLLCSFLHAEINVQKFSNQQLEDIIFQTCFEIELQDLMGYYEPMVSQCYEKVLTQKPVKRTELVEVAELIQRGQCGKICQIFEKLCQLLAEIDFSGSFTAIQEHNQILCEKFAGTFTLLADAQGTPTLIVDFGQEGFAGTFTALEELNEIACDKFQQTWTLFPCNQEIAIAGPTVITQPGTYCVCQSFAGSIVIDADCVVLDLNNFNISGAGGDIISTDDHNNIIIKNGKLSSGTADAVNIDNAMNVSIENVDFVDNATGINVLTATCVLVNNCSFRGHSAQSIVLEDVSVSQFNNCMHDGNMGVEVIRVVDSSCLSFNNHALCNNASATSLDIIFVENSQDINVKNIQVDNNSAASRLRCLSLSTTTSNVGMVNCSMNSNSANQFIGLSADGIACLTADALQIQNNISSTLDGEMIVLSNVVNARFAQMNISGNSATTLDLLGVNISSCNDINFLEVVITDNTGGLQCYGFGSLLSNNIVLCDVVVTNNTAVTEFFGGLFTLDDVVNVNKSSFSGNTGNASVGVRVVSTNNCSFLNCQFNDNTGLGGGDVQGLDLSTLSAVTVEGCSANNNVASAGNAFGFRAASCREVVIDKCIANNNNGTSNEGHGFEFASTSSSSIKNCIAKVNEGATARGINLENSFAVVIDSCVAEDNSGSTEAHGIVFENSFANVCNECTALGNSTDGILLDGADNNTLKENVCTTNITGTGIDLVMSNSNTVKLNTVNGNVTGIALDADSFGNCVTKNIVHKNSADGVVNNGSRNSFFINKSSLNGPSSTSNYSGVPASVIAIFDISSGVFVSGPANLSFDNISVVP